MAGYGQAATTKWSENTSQPHESVYTGSYVRPNSRTCIYLIKY